MVIGGWKYKENIMSSSNLIINQDISNTHLIGKVMYTDYILYFQISDFDFGKGFTNPQP